MTILSNLPTKWTSGITLTKGQYISNDGIVFETLNALTSTTEPRLDTTNFTVIGVQKVTNYYNLIEAVGLQLNVSKNPEINLSIPLFIQQTEEDFSAILRVPAQIRKVIATTEVVDGISRVSIPTDLQKLININLKTDSITALNGSNSSTLVSAGTVKMNSLTNEEYQDILKNPGRRYQYETMGFFPTAAYFEFAPTLSVGTEVEIHYYGAITQLGETAEVTNDAGVIINDAGQTEAEFIISNPGQLFVPKTELVIENYYTASCPQLLLAGAILQGLGFLKSDQNKIALWNAKYNDAYNKIDTMIKDYESGKSSSKGFKSQLTF